MTRGYAQRHRQSELNQFGKSLTRRAKSSCELCGVVHKPLSVFEVPPQTTTPELERCVYICTTCHHQFDNPKHLDSSHWRCLHNSVWSEVPAVQVMAVLQLKQLQGKPWADELRDHLYLQPEVEDWLARIH
ncbi:phnA protein [Pseudomaricurvus alkylphenolicus]|jgi:protein PhnA|uniref:phnA protein n=1 Tax=Pseudomaricurvus alkylphenolicus TaxID=1306991 RepID=UPI00141E915A|nr:phnA protein [Pseudomaricurvus alkylphenolicus]NIB42373.1 phnA protein [Pseudomaricurvus alkylphenolicus]